MCIFVNARTNRRTAEQMYKRITVCTNKQIELNELTDKHFYEHTKAD